MQPSSKEMQGMAASHVGLQELHNGRGAGHDDFFDQMMSGIAPSAWLPGLGNPKSLFGAGVDGKSPEELSVAEGVRYAPYDDSSLLASRLRQNQATGGGSSPTGTSMLLQLGHHQAQQRMLLQSMGQPPVAVGGGDSGGFLPLPLSLGSVASGDSGLLVDRSRDEVDAPFKAPNSTDAEALYHNGFGGLLQRAAQAPNQQQLLHHSQNYGGAPPPAAGMGHAYTTAPAVASASAGTAPPRPRVRARRGQATDPHSIAERLRRERIAERMKALQELVPSANKTDKASMLDEIIDYVKFLQLQVKVLSMSRLGGAAAVAPLAADMSPESGAGQGGANEAAAAAGTDSGLTAAEHQVAKLIEEDMGSAMQYLQGKGLCLMPISLASAISSAACHPRPPGGFGQLSRSPFLAHHPAGDGPASPSMSALTVQSTNGSADADVSRPSGSKDGAAVP